jgi:hypothetical protein
VKRITTKDAGVGARMNVTFSLQIHCVVRGHFEKNYNERRRCRSLKECHFLFADTLCCEGPLRKELQRKRQVHLKIVATCWRDSTINWGVLAVPEYSAARLRYA